MQSQNRICPIVGERWRHFSGDICVIICIGIHTETREHFVVYRAAGAHEEVHAWVRPLAVFMGQVEMEDAADAMLTITVNRFTKED